MGETELRDGCRSLMQLQKQPERGGLGAVSDDGPAFGTHLQSACSIAMHLPARWLTACASAKGAGGAG